MCGCGTLEFICGYHRDKLEWVENRWKHYFKIKEKKMNDDIIFIHDLLIFISVSGFIWYSIIWCIWRLV